MKKVRAKFSVQNKNETADGHQVVLMAVMGNSKENKEFFKYTPAGRIEMGLLVDKTAGFFKPGKNYYVDFTEAPDEVEDAVS